jgi:hypothetical protein
VQTHADIVRPDLRIQARHHLFELGQRHEPPRNVRLVGDDEDEKVALPQAADQTGYVRGNPKLAGPAGG